MTQQVSIDRSVDHSDLRRVILEEGTQFADGLAAVEAAQIDAAPFAQCTRVMVSGMGGSALPGDVVSAIVRADGVALPVAVNRTYDVPADARTRATLHIVCSHSGNTEETLSVLAAVTQAGLPCVGVSAGGKLAHACADADVPHVTLPIPFDNFQPRMATGHFVAVLLGVLERVGLVEGYGARLRALGAELSAAVPTLEEEGAALARTLHGATPVIYAPDAFWPLARIWKIKINENAKTPAFWNVFPELNHNEYVGFTNPQGRFHIVMLTDAQDHPRNRKRFDITAATLQERGIGVTLRAIPEGDIIARYFHALALADWTSYSLALLYGQDPTPVDMVEDFKALMVK